MHALNTKSAFDQAIKPLTAPAIYILFIHTPNQTILLAGLGADHFTISKARLPYKALEVRPYLIFQNLVNMQPDLGGRKKPP